MVLNSDPNRSADREIERMKRNPQWMFWFMGLMSLGIPSATLEKIGSEIFD